MIKFLLIINTQGKVRLSKYFEYLPDLDLRKQEADVIKTCLRREKSQVLYFPQNVHLPQAINSLWHVFVWFVCLFYCLFDMIILGRVFLGWTSTKQGLMCHAQGHNAASDTVEAWTCSPLVSSQTLYHGATALPIGMFSESEINVLSIILLYLIFISIHAKYS